ncbi:MAG: hypothetical protein LAQ30_04695 [Acidobacteriia bacterium]|nr:hypothetical protein [Terriglobia bacterium]
MERESGRRRIEVDFATEPFDSAPRMLLRSTGLYLSHLPFLATVTLVVYLPVKLAVQLVFSLLNVSNESVLSYALLEVLDLVLSALVIPAAIYGVVGKLRSGRRPRVWESLRWGRRQWGRLLWNKVKVEITVGLRALLLIVPGITAMARLALTDAVVAIEADSAAEPLARSSDLTHGRRWRVFFVLLPFLPVDLFGAWLVLAVPSRVGFALADCALAVAEQWLTVAVMLMYLGVAGRSKERAAKKR